MSSSLLCHQTGPLSVESEKTLSLFGFCILEEIKYSYHSTCGCANFECSASLWVVLADKHHRNNKGIHLTFLAADMPLETFLIATPMETGTHH